MKNTDIKCGLIAVLLLMAMAIVFILWCIGTWEDNAGYEEFPAETWEAPAVRSEGLKVQAVFEGVEPQEIVKAEPEQVTVKLESSAISTVYEQTAPAEQVVSQVNDAQYATTDHTDEIYLLAQAMAGESYAHDTADQRSVGVAICNRVDDSRFPDTVYGVVSQPWQIQGWHSYNVPAQVYIDTATEVINAWYAIKGGAVIEWWDSGIFWWCSAGDHNEFRGVY